MTSKATLRVQRYRRRQKGELIPVSVEIPYSLAEALIECGVLSDNDMSNHSRRCEAINDWIISQLRMLA